MNLQSIVCYYRAFIKLITGKGFQLHDYVEKDHYIADIAYNKNKFHIASSCDKFIENEHFVKDAILIGHECKCCGKRVMSWKRRDDIIQR